jgi:hypothetical protein
MDKTVTNIIKDQSFDEERALYGLRGAAVERCVFAGEADGESALKECRDVSVADCSFSLRYPLWHAERFSLVRTSMDTLTRAPIWYSSDGEIRDCRIYGTKTLRECAHISLDGCRIDSAEFGWKCKDVKITNCEINSEYIFLDSENVDITSLKMSGKYSFQYVKGLKIKDSILNTKDAFWHAENVTVENSTVNGEYLGWFSKGLTLINCHIKGTQPFCYCESLKLIGCTMEDTDLAFEYSDVEANVSGHILSVKNPRSGYVKADSIGEIINDGSVIETSCEIKVK